MTTMTRLLAAALLASAVLATTLVPPAAAQPAPLRIGMEEDLSTSMSALYGEGAWDLARIVGTIPDDKAFRSLAESDCPLIRK